MYNVQQLFSSNIDEQIFSIFCTNGQWVVIVCSSGSTLALEKYSRLFEHSA